MTANSGPGAARWLAVLLITAPLTGCPGDDDDSADDDAPWPESFSGQLEIHSTHDGEVACDAFIELAGASLALAEGDLAVVVDLDFEVTGSGTLAP